ncbi:MAG: hypothetical protein HC869_16355 [Rhodospirillales bacterium]|nr:hypothetical protein [Rhodospirillales bacterium]
MLEALAAVVLCGLMLVPVINIGVGLIAGFVLGGIGGALVGAVVGFVISAIWAPIIRGY